MRMVRLIVKCRIPFEFVLRNAKCVCEFFGMRTAQFSPRICVVITESFRIFTAKRNDHRPHIAFVCIEFIRNLREIDALKLIGKQSVCTDPFDTGTGCNIICVGFLLHRFVCVVLDCTGNKLRSVSDSRMRAVILVFKHLFAVGKIFKYLLNELLLVV